MEDLTGKTPEELKALRNTKIEESNQLWTDLQAKRAEIKQVVDAMNQK